MLRAMVLKKNDKVGTEIVKIAEIQALVSRPPRRERSSKLNAVAALCRVRGRFHRRRRDRDAALPVAIGYT